ncbi:MAG: DUF2231 domain-containing protein [Roseiflexaceae bacterium]
MSNFFADLLAYPHPMINHFVIALLIVSVLLDLCGRWNPAIRYTAWVTLVLGTLATIPTVISGVVAHFPYEESSAIGAISTHEQLGLATTGIFLVLTIWRWRTRRRDNTAPASWLYLALAVVGLGVLTITGMTGGNLVYQLGVGVQQLVK